MKDKRIAYTVNIWYSPTVKRWNVCVLVELPCHADQNILRREKTSYKSLRAAMTYIQKTYKGK